MKRIIQVTLYLNGHCVETAAKETLQKLLDAMLQSETEDQNLHERYQLLYDFLHTADFKQLRASDERLTGIVPTVCEVYRDENGKPAIRIL
ncbi:MAG TPA: hypothetical protein PL059_12175 [Spirochaetota bacterium]|nr:hypothetical protein [Spirochaetota bacterium]